MFTRIMLLLLSVNVVAAEPTVYQWRDSNGVTHFSDSQQSDGGIKEDYWQAQAEAVVKAPKSVTTTRKSANSHRDDEDERPVLSAECEWLRGRIANLRRLTHGNRDSVFYGELERRQSEWKKTQCQRGTHIVNRDLLPVRKVNIKSN